MAFWPLQALGTICGIHAHMQAKHIINLNSISLNETIKSTAYIHSFQINLWHSQTLMVCIPLIPALMWQRQVDLQVQGQPGLKDSKDYTETLSWKPNQTSWLESWLSMYCSCRKLGVGVGWGGQLSPLPITPAPGIHCPLCPYLAPEPLCPNVYSDH